MIINFRRHPKPRIWLYPMDLHMDYPDAPDDLERQIPHEALVHICRELPAVADVVLTSIKSDEDLRLDADGTKSVDLNAFKLSLNLITLDEAEAFLRQEYQESSDFEDFDSLINTISEDDFYRHHHLAVVISQEKERLRSYRQR